MDRNSPEYQKFKAEYEAKEKYRRDHPDEYPWFAYFQFGFHRMTYLSDAEKDEDVEFYHLRDMHDGSFARYGRQPITITRRE